MLAIRLVDPLERQLPDVGLLVMQDAETGEQLLVDTHGRGFRRRFEEATAARRSARAALPAGLRCLIVAPRDAAMLCHRLC